MWFDCRNFEPYQFKPRAQKLPLEFVAQGVRVSREAQEAGTASVLYEQPAGVESQPPLELASTASLTFTRAKRQLDAVAPPMAIPGLVGELVDYCWHSANYQVAEPAIASALATMSLLASRAYRHGTLGFNLYILTLAQTSTGKSFGYSANDRWLNAIYNRFMEVRGPNSVEAKRRAEHIKKMIITNPGSAQGLKQHISENPSVLWHADEYVEQIKLMSHHNPPANVAQIRAELLQLFEMSAPGRNYRGAAYSKRGSRQVEVEKDVLSASLSILATGTPEAFYDDLAPNLLTSGFMPRFILMEYTGNIPRRNSKPVIEPSVALVDKLSILFNYQYEKSQQLTGNIEEPVNVQPANAEVEHWLDTFEEFCILEAHAANESGMPTAGLWSRCPAHVRKIASLIAIGCNYQCPQITKEHVEIAVNIVRPGVERLCAKFKNGEVGIDDDRRVNDLRTLLGKMFLNPDKYKGYPGVKAHLIESGLFQRYTMSNICSKMASFKGHKMGSTKAFEETFNLMLRNGEIETVVITGERLPVIKLNEFMFYDIFKQLTIKISP